MRLRGGGGGGLGKILLCGVFFFPLTWEGQVSVPDALPSWAWDSRHAPASHMPAQGCCNALGNLGRAPSSPYSAHRCKEPSSTHQLLHIPLSRTVGTHVV